MNILLAIDESAGLRVLKHLGRGPHRVVGALVPSVSARSEGIHALAERWRVPVYPGRAARDPHFAGWIRSQQVDLLISVHFSDIFCPENVASPRIGAFNLHPGPLPRYAGLNPVSWAIFNGEVEYGVTLHWISREIDAGPVAYRSPITIGDMDSAYEVMNRCTVAGVELVERLVEDASRSRERIPAEDQDRRARRYYQRPVPNDGWIDWDRSARDIVNFVRACDFMPFQSPWGSPRSRRGTEVIEFLRLSPAERPVSGVPGSVVISDGTVVVSARDRSLRVELIRIGTERRNPADVFSSGDRLTSS